MRKVLRWVCPPFVVPPPWRAMIIVALITAATAMLMSALLFRSLVDDRVDNTIKTEAICSKTYQGKPCQELLTRLWTSMTEQQKIWVACGALGVLDDKRTRPIYKRQCR